LKGLDGKPVLIFGYGNPGRQDDGLGPAMIEEIECLGYSFVETDANYQLSIEDAAEMAEHDFIILIDTTVQDVDCFSIRKVLPSSTITFTSHLVNPESVVALCEDAFGRVPDVWIIGIRGYEFEFAEGFTERARENYRETFHFITQLLRTYEERTMATTQNEEKTVLIIDDDADIRASMRIVLEAAGFSIGEAGDGEEGLKVAQKVNPDAVIVDLMMETVDAGSKVSAKLKESGFKGPIYLLSAAGDTVRYNIDAKELGLDGIFQKPINHEILISTLKTKLNIK